MKRTTFFAIMGITFLLIAGFVLFRVMNSDVQLLDDGGEFQTWFWEKRGLDLAVQVLLVFAGALGIAAILPVEEDDV